MKIAILGGGTSGVILARLLQEKGHEVHLYEAQAELGGLCRTKIIDGFVYDLGGGHILHSRNENVLNYILDSTGRENWNKNVRNTKIFLKGHYVKYPFENGLADLPKEDNFECLLGYIYSHFERKYLDKPVPQNFYDWIVYKFGKGIANKFMIPYNQKIWNYNLKHLSTQWIEGRVPSAPVEDVIKSSVGLITEGYQHQSQFYYPKTGGFQTLVTNLATPLKNVHLSTPINSIDKLNNKWVINSCDEYDDVISTLALQELLHIIKNTPPFLTATLESLWYNGVLTVFIGLNKSFDHDYSWLYLPEKEAGPANRITFLSNYSKHNAPEDCGSVLAEITYKAKFIPDKVDEVIQNVVNALHDTKIIDKNNVILTDSYFYKYGYPVYGLKFKEFIQIINNYLNEYKLKRFGRFATHAYVNVDHVVESAFEFVDKWY